MQCHEVRNAIPDLIEGLLDFEDDFAVRQHINSCHQCFAALRTFEQDEVAITQYVHRAPFAPVARNVMDEIDRGRSAWWDAFMAGSYRLASVAGLVLVILVVSAGGFALREMANSNGNGDEPVQEQPAQDSTLGVASQEADDDASQPMLIGQDDIPRIVEQLDEQGLVVSVGEIDETDDYRFEYRRIAFDRHLTLLEYRADAPENLAAEINVELSSSTGEDATRSISLTPGETREGWLVLPGMPEGTSEVSVGSARAANTTVDAAHAIPVDLSPIGEFVRDTSYETAVTNNGVELCCLQIERGVVVSVVHMDYQVIDPNALVPVDQSPAPYPEVTVDGEQIAKLDHGLGLTSVGTDVQSLGVVDLPDSGQLSIEYEHLTLVGSAGERPESVEGPWLFNADLKPPEAEPDPTPEPTIPPDVAQQDPTATPGPEPSPTPTDDADQPDTLRVLVYLVRNGELAAAAREVDYTQDVATAATEELLAGLTSDEQDFALGTAVPEGTEMLDISLHDGTVAVNLSEEFSVEAAGGASLQMRMAQVVHTLTQFETVDGVDILVEGQPIAPRGGEAGNLEELDYTREDFEDVAPAILLEHPTPGEIVTSGQVRLRGTSNTFEANLQIEVIGPSGEQIYRDHAMASSGTGTRGEFDVSVPLDVSEDGWGTIRLFEHSARDGSRTNVVDVPVRFQVE